MKNLCKKKLVKGLAGFLSVGLIATTFSAVNSGSTSNNESRFLIQTAKQVVLKPGQLTLTRPDAKVLWFANSPSTAVVFYTLNNYMQYWSANGYFSQDNPNATLIGYFTNPQTHQEQKLTLVMTLNDANYNTNKQVLTYAVTKTYLVPEKKSYNQQVTLEHATLLIDDLPPGGQGTYGPAS